ncbi:MAG: IS200/IS605 family element transposase accessory protein TnpB [Deinococcus sp.]|nr:IS200/IS605 family element transposase accessory protein TnpB [Deinococcus sp.]
MKLTACVKLQPTAEQAHALRQTLERANAACNHISAWAWKHQTFGQWALHRALYRKIRATFHLSAQVTVRVLAKVADAYKLDKRRKRVFLATGSIAYDERILRWHLMNSTVSLWTLQGRMTMPFVCGERQRQLLVTQQGESDLAYVDGAFYLCATCNVETPDPADVQGVLGCDLGIVNILADSDGNTYSGAMVNGLRHRHRRLRKRLQAKGTPSARWLLKKRRRKERRFATDTNHRISKAVVAHAQGTGRALALEDLGGIRDRLTVQKRQRATLSSWSFGQLRQFLTYKAQRAGVLLLLVDPRHTSRTCPVCGGIDQRNRPTQARFCCVSCGCSGPADTIAAENIRRAAVNLPHAGGSLVSCHTLPASRRL